VYNDKIIYLKITQFNNHNLLISNDNLTYFIPLCSNKIINNKKRYNKNIRNIIFKNTNLPIINKLEIKFTDYNDNKLNINNLDYNINNNIRDPNNYIRHPKNDLWQSHIVLKIGTIEPFVHNNV
jgi:vesicle coat complex subunit